jgi:hypothetical protein
VKLIPVAVIVQFADTEAVTVNVVVAVAAKSARPPAMQATIATSAMRNFMQKK